MDMRVWIFEISAIKIGFSERLDIFEIFVNKEDVTIIKIEIYLTWQAQIVISQVWAGLAYHLHLSVVWRNVQDSQ